MGWFAENEGSVIAGAGLHLSTFGPKTRFLGGGKSVHVANVFSEPAYHMRGVANELLEVILTWARSESIAEMTLSASDEAKPLYQRLGFVPDAARHTLKL